MKAAFIALFAATAAAAMLVYTAAPAAVPAAAEAASSSESYPLCLDDLADTDPVPDQSHPTGPKIYLTPSRWEPIIPMSVN